MNIYILVILLFVIAFYIFKNTCYTVEKFTGNWEEQKHNMKNFWGYYGNSLHNSITNSGPGKFIDLDSKGENIVPIAPIPSLQDSEISKKIEQCNIINSTGDCNNIPSTRDEKGCGFCASTNKIVYGDDNGPIADVCPGDDNWIPPGPKISEECTKKKERDICKKMTRCSDITGEKSICAWCPITNTGMVKRKGNEIKNGIDNWEPKYPESDKCEWGSSDTGKYSTLIFGLDNCQKFESDFPCMASGKALTGPHSDACKLKLWRETGCSTDFNNFEQPLTENQNNILSEAKKKWETENIPFTDIKTNMETMFQKLSSTLFGEKRDYTKMCKNEDVEPCDPTLNPTPVECYQKVFKESGCTDKGEDYPKQSLSQPWLIYKDTIRKLKTDLETAKSNATWDNMSELLENSKKCIGVLPKPLPIEKPCWRDFVLRMRTMSNVTLENKNLKIGETYINKSQYEEEYFPFWNYLKQVREYWDTNWTLFVNTLKSVPKVVSRQDSTHGLVIHFKPGSVFTDLVQNTNNRKYFLGSDIGDFITENKFKEKDFPFWSFYWTAKIN